jgi:hypothetical protein
VANERRSHARPIRSDADQQQFVIDFAAGGSDDHPRKCSAMGPASRGSQLPAQVGRTLLTTIGDGRCPGQFASIGKPKMGKLRMHDERRQLVL